MIKFGNILLLLSCSIVVFIDVHAEIETTIGQDKDYFSSSEYNFGTSNPSNTNNNSPSLLKVSPPQKTINSAKSDKKISSDLENNRNCSGHGNPQNIIIIPQKNMRLLDDNKIEVNFNVLKCNKNAANYINEKACYKYGFANSSSAVWKSFSFSDKTSVVQYGITNFSTIFVPDKKVNEKETISLLLFLGKEQDCASIAPSQLTNDKKSTPFLVDNFFVTLSK